MFELSIKIKSEDRTFTKKECVYDNVVFSVEDPTLQLMVESAKKEFAQPIESINLTAKLSWE